MSNIILLFLCMLIGVALRRYGRVPDNAHLAINGFIINVSLPAPRARARIILLE